MRISPSVEDMIVIHALQEQMAEAVAKFPAGDWAKVAAAVGVPVQRALAEEALLDPLLVEDGSVVEVDGIRMVGRTYQLREDAGAAHSRCRAARRAHGRGEGRSGRCRAAGGGRPRHDPPDRIAARGRRGARPRARGGRSLRDAAPGRPRRHRDQGQQRLFDSFWMQTSIAMCCNRRKQSITIDLKDLEGMAVLRDLVRTADVVQHNMRYDAAERLGVDYESLRQLKPDLIYCHTEATTRRMLLPATTRPAPPSPSVVDGGRGRDGAMPIWPNTSLGDTGNGYLSAVGILQALYHRAPGRGSSSTRRSSTPIC